MGLAHAFPFGGIHKLLVKLVSQQAFPREKGQAKSLAFDEID